QLVNAGDPCQAVPLVAAALAPAGDPVLAVFGFLVGAVVDAATGNAGLVAFVECSGVHVALLSSHRVSLRVRRRRRQPRDPAIWATGGAVSQRCFACICLSRWRSITTWSAAGARLRWKQIGRWKSTD